MKTIIVMCPSHRDRRELALLPQAQNFSFVFHEYLSDILEEMTTAKALSHKKWNICADIELIIAAYAHENIAGIVSTDDYPGSTIATILAHHYNLLGVDSAVNLVCQHKYYARQAQQKYVPAAVPNYMLVNPGNFTSSRTFPFFVKPVKSFFSIGAYAVTTQEELHYALNCCPPALFFEPFDQLCSTYAGFNVGDCYLLAEDLLQGDQVTVEGFVHHHEVTIVGIVDSIMFPGTLSFARFDYPSHLVPSVQERMAAIARAVMTAIGFNNGLFNIEMIYNSSTDTIFIIEINPRMSSQFADLFEKVDGTNSYEILLDVTLGKKPLLQRSKGRYTCASSCVLRTFEDYYVERVPTHEEIHMLEHCYPDIRIEILTGAGIPLSQQLQDGRSFRYGLLNIGGRDEQDITTIFDDCRQRLSFVFKKP
jgi:hypothetical protein